MDLSSSGIITVLILSFCSLTFGQILIDDESESSYINDNHYRYEEDTKVSGDIYILDRLSTVNEPAVEELLQDIVETQNKVIVKLAGRGISVIRDPTEVSDVIKYRDNGDRHNVVEDILDILQVAEKNVHINVITEDESSTAEGTQDQLALIKERDIRVDVIFLPGHSNYYDMRHRRQINFYQLLANVSGGSVIQTNKNNIGSALNLLKQSIKTTLVHVMRFFDHSPPGKEFRIPVDDTMTQLIFRVQVERSNPVIIAVTPLGIPSSTHPKLLGKASAGTVVGILEVNLTKADHGTWKISKLDSNMWDIKVDGESPIDFTHEFLERGAGGFGEYPIKGRPIVGKTYKLSITVPEYAKVKKVAMGMLFNMGQLMPIDMKPLTNVGGRRGKSMFYANITVPKDNFMVGIEGRDISGHMFRRIDPILITPISLKLEIPSLIGVKFYQNETLSIPFTVINEGAKEQDVDVKIEDDKKFALPPSILSATIKPGENFTGRFIIRAGLTVGETTTVTVTAKPYLGPRTFSPGQFEIRRFNVLDKNLTTTTLSTPTTSTSTTASTSTLSTQTTSTTKSTATITSSTKATSPSVKSTSLGASKVTQASTSTAAKIHVTGGKTSISPSVSSITTKTASSSVSSGSSNAVSSQSPISNTASISTTSNAPAGKGSTQSKSIVAKTTAQSKSEKETDNTDLPTTAIVIGVSTGAFVGVAAIGAMALVFRRALKKSMESSVQPSRQDPYDRRRQSSIAWT
ncbi:uncharacterized protein LOC132753018 [Ruditapes philippinarum]|uniref:uncharacterized protein LOC132753018 n=1 Tax=Ruditapes philippinarum TaxID=129788 RepID=UPI00295C0EDC|nr:uncharacterized protein LOC132753018 [Ruditapes philippinarum]